MDNQLIGKWAFIIGLIIAVIAGFITSIPYAMLILFILGLVVGFLNITEKDIVKFLVASATLLILGVASINALSILGIISDYINAILSNFIAFVSAASLVTALKAIITTTKI